jgi:thymidylate kinase
MQKLFKNVIVFKTPKEYLPREDSKKARAKIRDFYIRRANEAYETLKSDPSKIIILDRFFLSELVY